MTLAERIVALQRALAGRRIPHAFGGATALAYWTLDPRGANDLDVNVFLPAAKCARALRALPQDVEQPLETEAAIRRDGQVRLWWGETPLDLFFDTAPLHAAAARHVRTVPFAGTQISVLGPVELAVFKVLPDRTRDWADIEAMLMAETLDLDAVRETLRDLLDARDARFARLADADRRARLAAAEW